MEVKVLLENHPHVGRSSSWRSRWTWRPPRWTFIVVEVKVDLETPMLDIDRHGGQGPPGEPSPRWTFIVVEDKVDLETPMLDIDHHGGQGPPGEPPMLDINDHGGQGPPGEPLHVGRSLS
ncbi:hypothetical protein GRJ2_002709400 [Grus japonensis]|uniref:Uncharacterized protein n=1 Tax=Grus japonensis TaxID=30415 RepID=A0ABC9XXM4_GRUJA